jgi:hypothetical protein
MKRQQALHRQFAGTALRASEPRWDEKTGPPTKSLKDEKLSPDGRPLVATVPPMRNRGRQPISKQEGRRHDRIAGNRRRAALTIGATEVYQPQGKRCRTVLSGSLRLYRPADDNRGQGSQHERAWLRRAVRLRNDADDEILLGDEGDGAQFTEGEQLVVNRDVDAGGPDFERNFLARQERRNCGSEANGPRLHDAGICDEVEGNRRCVVEHQRNWKGNAVDVDDLCGQNRASKGLSRGGAGAGQGIVSALAQTQTTDADARAPDREIQLTVGDVGVAAAGAGNKTGGIKIEPDMKWLRWSIERNRVGARRLGHTNEGQGGAWSGKITVGDGSGARKLGAASQNERREKQRKNESRRAGRGGAMWTADGCRYGAELAVKNGV